MFAFPKGQSDIDFTGEMKKVFNFDSARRGIRLDGKNNFLFSFSRVQVHSSVYIYIYKSGNLIKKEERRAEKTKRLTQAQRDRLFDLIES